MSVLIPVSLRPALLRHGEECKDNGKHMLGPTGLFEAGSISPRTFGAAAVRVAH